MLKEPEILYWMLDFSHSLKKNYMLYCKWNVIGVFSYKVDLDNSKIGPEPPGIWIIKLSK